MEESTTNKKDFFKALLVGVLCFVVTTALFVCYTYIVKSGTLDSIENSDIWMPIKELLHWSPTLINDICNPFYGIIIYALHGHLLPMNILLKGLDLIFWIGLAIILLLKGPKRRLIGLSVCGTFFIFFGLNNIGLGLPKLFFNSLMTNHIFVHALVVAISGVVFFIGGIYLLLLKRWAWILTIASSIVIGLFSALEFRRIHDLVTNKPDYYKEYHQHYLFIVLLILFCSLIYYLTRPKVKEQFR